MEIIVRRWILFYVDPLDLRSRIQCCQISRMSKSNPDQGVTPCWKSVHRISGYQGYQQDIRGVMNGYQEKIDQISIIYLTDFSRILKYISWIYLNISQISVDRPQSKKKWNIAENSNVLTEYNSRILRISTGYQSPFVHRISWVATPEPRLSREREVTWHVL